MTSRARLVLEDVRAAAKELPRLQAGPHDEPTIRRRWIAVMALLRAVGHVLKEVDYKSSDALARAINQKWAEPKPIIHTEFIDKYRHAVIKRYEQPHVDFDKIMGTLYPRLNVEYDGRVGVSVNYLIEEAVRYWEDYLDDIDHRAACCKLGTQT